MSAPWVGPTRRRYSALEVSAALLGPLTFFFGFLDWWGDGISGQNGYRLLDGYLPVGFALLAALFTAVNLRPPRTEAAALMGLGSAFLGVVFTVLAIAVKPTLLNFLEQFSSFGDSSQGVHLTVRVGLVLTMTATGVQFAFLLFAWLAATGRVARIQRERHYRPLPPPPAAPPADELVFFELPPTEIDRRGDGFGPPLQAYDGEWRDPSTS